MQVLVFSDSHGLLTNMKKAIREHPQIGYMIHLGDYGTDASEIGAEFPHLNIEVVQGNCDRIREHPEEKVLKLGGKSIFITHGHMYGVKYNMASIIEKGVHEDFDVILFGHTHEPYVEWRKGILLVNPGSISKTGFGPGITYAILKIGVNGIEADIKRI